METVFIEGGVCAPDGFKAGGVHCGIRNNKGKNDLAMIVSERMCAAAAVYTSNKVKGAPIEVTKENISDGRARVLICNSGNANTCAPGGMETALETCRITAEALGCSSRDVIIASTGVIGEKLDIAPFRSGIPELCRKLSPQGAAEAAEGILTTDTVKKEAAVEFSIGGKKCRMGGMAKGSGMIHPNMATMLCFITSDAAVSPDMLQQILSEDVKGSFNQLSIDGDTSTNDMVAVMASGAAGNPQITARGEEYDIFAQALRCVTENLVKKMAADGEGAGKLIEADVEGAPDMKTARAVSRSIISSSLFKAAMFGEDANWGRIICAIGYAQGSFSVGNIDIDMESSGGMIPVCRGSTAVPFDEDRAAEILSKDEITVHVGMNQGCGRAKAWGCDLTHDYVTINGDYRT